MKTQFYISLILFLLVVGMGIYSYVSQWDAGAIIVPILGVILFIQNSEK